VATRPRDLVYQRLQAVGPARAEDDRSAALGEVPRRSLAEAAAGAGDDDDFSADVVRVHGHASGISRP
jgi:hypothetical protein